MPENLSNILTGVLVGDTESAKPRVDQWMLNQILGKAPTDETSVPGTLQGTTVAGATGGIGTVPKRRTRRKRKGMKTTTTILILVGGIGFIIVATMIVKKI